MGRRKKILIVNNRLGYYGAENVLINMVNHMDYEKYDITVMTLSESNSDCLNQNVKYKHIFSNHSGVVGKIENKIKLLLGYQRLANLYCRNYDIAIAFKMGESAQIVGYSNARKKYCWIHSNVSEIEETHSYSFQSLEEEQEFLKCFDSLIAVSRYCENSFRIKYGNDYETKVIYNPVDIEKINEMADEEIPEPEKYLFDDGVPVLGMCGRIDSQKGVDRLIYIAEKLKNKNEKFRMVIIGDGIDYKKYSNLIEEKKLPVYMLGFKSNPYKYIKNFDLFICSSIWESYSLVVNEALILNVPVISTRCGGPEEVLCYGKYGILTDNNKESLYGAVEDFLQNNMNLRHVCYEKNPMEEFLKEINKLLEGSLE